MTSQDARVWKHGLWAVAALAAAIRLHNAIAYRMDLGFDASQNWRYIRHLMLSWALPDPDEGWSTGHPPLFYYLSAALARAIAPLGSDAIQIAIPLASSALGIAMAFLASGLVRRIDPARPHRAFLAGALVLLLPAHIYMSAMLSEEILAAFLISLAVTGFARVLATSGVATQTLWSAVGLGAVAGLAFLTKLSGVLVGLAGAGAFALVAWRTLHRDGAARATTAALCAVGVLAATGLVGGWYYARNWVQFGYLYPQDLAVHGVILEMPPGERFVSDYLRVPLATFTDPQLLQPDLLRSVWGGTYATAWFDGHRHFLPRDDTAVSRMGGLILLLALLPTAALVIGAGRALRRVARGESDAEIPLLLLGLLTLLGYVQFTWQNPYFVCVKGSYLLGLGVPFSVFASEPLADWTRGRTLRARCVWAALALLALAVSLTFTFGLWFKKLEGPGLPWQTLAG